MSSSVGNLSSSNLESIVPENQSSESGVSSYRSTGNGKRVRVMNSEDSKIGTSKLFGNFLAILPEVAGFVSEEEYSKLPIVSREFKHQVSNARAVNIRSNEIWGCESSVRLSPEDYIQLVKHKEGIRDIVSDHLLSLSAPEVLDFVRELEKFNSETAAKTLKSYCNAEEDPNAPVGERDKIELAQAAKRLGLEDEYNQLLEEVRIHIHLAVRAEMFGGEVYLKREIDAILGQENINLIKKMHMCLDYIERKRFRLHDLNEDI
ncbi:MAG: hypothetical protein WAM28_06220, partial [Chlamydiales bacterium]